MRNICVYGFLEVESRGTHKYSGNARPKEACKICVSFTDVNCSCDIQLIDSRYLLCNGEEQVYGEAASFVDRAFEKAFSLMVDSEVATLDINIPKRLIDDDSSEDISLTCIAQLSVVVYGKTVYETDVEEKLALASKYKNLGVKLYKEGGTAKQMSSFLFFSQSLKWLAMINLKEVEDKEGEIKELKMQCYNNIGLYHLHNHNYSLALEAASRVLRIDCKNVKALYRRAVANTELQNYEDAEDDLKTALILDPNSGPIKKQQEELKKKQKVLSQKYAAAMKKFLS